MLGGANTLSFLVSRIREERRPVRFITSRVLWRTGLCKLLTFDTLDGYRMRFHPSAVSAAIWEDPSFRREDVLLLRTILRPGDTYIDVGANVGQLALAGAVRVGAEGHVLAVEAHPRTYEFLRENVALNGLSQIDLKNAAVGDRPGRVSFTSLATDDQNRVAVTPDVVNPLEVEMTPLERIVPSDAAIRLMKIDVEGFEVRALEGAAGILPNCECVYIEESASNLAVFDATPGDLRRRLDTAGFRIFAIHGRTLAENPRDDTPEHNGNLLAIRRDRVDAIAELIARG